MPILAVLLVVIAVGSFVAYRVVLGAGGSEPDVESQERGVVAVAVETAAIEAGLIRDVRTLTGSLEAWARFSVAARVGGSIQSVHVDLGDVIERGQVIVDIEDSEFVQAVLQAEAELAVRRAELSRAESDRSLAQRAYDRAQTLNQRGIASESELDQTFAGLESAKASLTLAEARVQQAEAALELANIELSYAEVKAEWEDGPDRAIVAERFADAGTSVQPGDAIISVAVLEPLIAAVFVTEGDYARLAVGQPATITTDARPGETFAAEIVRMSPVFREASRQARIELQVANPDRVLRPGMFIRTRIVLAEVNAETIVPTAAIIQRGGRDVVFTVNADVQTVAQHTIETGIEQEGRVQIISPQLSGDVVVLGQHLLEDGAAVTISDERTVAREAEE